jgi:DNA repair protein RecO (recombination protein O)
MERDSKCFAIVVKTAKVRENDRLITLLSPDRGLFDVYVYGARKSVKSVKAPLYTEGVFSLYQKGENGKISLKDIDVISTHDGILDDLDSNLLASLFSEMVIKGKAQDASIYKLYTEALDALESENLDKVAAIFILHFLALSGLSGTYRECPNCQRVYSDAEVLGFSLSMGVAVCNECDTMNMELILPPNARLYAARALELPFNEALQLGISQEQIQRIAWYLKRCLRYSFPSHLNTLDMGF